MIKVCNLVWNGKRKEPEFLEKSRETGSNGGDCWKYGMWVCVLLRVQEWLFLVVKNRERVRKIA